MKTVFRGRRAPTALCGLVALLAGLFATAPAQAEPAAQRPSALRVCQDPNNLPMSNARHEGFENKIAELLAKEMGVPVEYTFFPQRMGFIRNTLKGKVNNDYKCDLVTGLSEESDLAATTKPYFRSTYALVYVKGRGLDDIRSQEDLAALERARADKLRIGVFIRTPAADWLLKHKLIDQGVPYQLMTGDPDQYPGQVLEQDLVQGKIDMAFIWGPIAGYVAKRVKDQELVVIPLKSEDQVRFDYGIAMGVRYGEREWKKQVEQLLEKNRDRINGILRDYGVPLVDEKGMVISTAR